MSTSPIFPRIPTKALECAGDFLDLLAFDQWIGRIEALRTRLQTCLRPSQVMGRPDDLRNLNEHLQA